MKMARITPKSYLCPRVKEKPDVSSGNVFSPAWEHAPWTDDFVDIQGEDSGVPPPRHSTRMKLMWDDDALYVGAWMEEPQVVATIKERNSVIFQDNDFELFLNPDGSNHQYYEFEVNALNTVWELRLDKPYMHGGSEHSERVGMRGQGNLRNLESGILVDGAVNDPGAVSKGWGVTARFPFADLIAQGHCKSPPRQGDVWRINSSRVQWRWEWRVEEGKGSWQKIEPEKGEDNWVWSPQGLVNMHVPDMWGFLRFEPAYAAPLPTSPAEEACWPARKSLLCARFLMPDYMAGNGGKLPADLQELGVQLEDGFESGVVARDNLPGGYEVWVKTPTGQSTSVRGDGLIFPTSVFQ